MSTRDIVATARALADWARQLTNCDRQPWRSHVLAAIIVLSPIVIGFVFFRSSDSIGQPPAEALAKFVKSSPMVADKTDCEKPASKQASKVQGDMWSKCLKVLSRQVAAAAALVQGQMMILLTSILVVLAFAAMLLKRTGRVLFCFVLGAICIRAAFYAVLDAEYYSCDSIGFRKLITLLHPKCAAYAGAWVPTEALDHPIPFFGGSIDGIAYLVWLASGFMVFVLASVCYRTSLWPAVTDEDLDGSRVKEDFHRRRSHLVATAGAGAVLFSVGIFRMKTLLEYPTTLYAEGYREALETMAKAIVGSWAFLFSLVLLLIISAAALALRLDVREAAERVGGKTPAERRKWVEEHGLALPSKDILAALAASAAPLLTPAATELITRVSAAAGMK